MRYLAVMVSCLVAACSTPGPHDGSLAIDTVSRGQLLPGASCTVNTGAGSWSVVTPAAVMIGNPVGDLRILCNKDGFRSSEVLYRPAGQSGSSIGVGIGAGSGNVGVGLGFSFPRSFGIGRYPSRITVDMNPQ